MTHDDPYEELAALFLTHESADARHASTVTAEGRRPRPGQPGMDLVLVGHLPVRAALWLAPFAGAVAQRQGLTALVRLDGDEPLVQVFGGTTDPMRTGSCRNLRETILFLGRTVRTWLLRPAPQTDAAVLVGLKPARITVLSGTDEAAVVHAYRLIRQLHDAAVAAGGDLPDIDLAVLGSNEAAAEEMLSRLNRTAETWALRPFSCRFALPRIESSVRSSGLRSFPGEVRPQPDEVGMWISIACAQFHRDAEHPRESPADRSPESRVESERTPPAESIKESAPDAVSAGGSEGPAVAARPEPLEGVTAVRAARFFEARPPADPVEEDVHGVPVPLWQRVPGLTGLAVRMPGHEHAELAVDARGVVHVLMRDDRLRDAGVIQAWIRAHREILALACRDQPIDAAGRSEVHLFTGDPMRVADLHGAAYHLHLLTRVAAGEGHVFVSMPLGRPARL